MKNINVLFRMLFLMATAESHVLIGKSECTTEEGESGALTKAEDCSDPRASSARRKSRRFSYPSKNMVCCPFNGGRRRSSVQKIVYRGDSEHNKRCGAMAGAAPPDPASGCCGRDLDVVSRIIGGRAAEPRQYPWLALIEYRDEQGGRTELMCSGSLISARYVLTAKHCVTAAQRNRATPASVILSEYDRTTEVDCVETDAGRECTKTTSIAIEDVRLHPTRDLALLRLAEAAPYSDYIRPICLPESDVTLSADAGLEFAVAGWGLTRAAGRSPSRTSAVKLHTSVPFVPLDSCARYYAHSNRMKRSENQICAGGRAGHDSCNGDSGSPLMHDNGTYQSAVGVVSFGPRRCGTAGRPAVHVNVHAAKEWILANIVH